MRGLRFSLGLFALALTLVPGCGGGDKKVRLAFVSNNSAEFWTIAQKGTQKAEKDFGVAVEFKMPSDGSAEAQRQIIDDLLNKGIQGIAVSANDAKNSVNYFKNEVAKRVPLVMQDNDLPDPIARRCYIGTNNYVAGRAVGELITRAVPQGGKIAIFVGRMDSQNAIERRQGVLDYLMNGKADQQELEAVTAPDAANLPLGEKYVLLDTKTDLNKDEDCQNYARQLLLSHPDLTCLVGLWAYNPPALLRAAREAGRQGKVVIVGFDEADETLEGIKSGEIYASLVQNPFEFGYQSIKILAGLARGDENAVKGRPDVDAQGRIFIPHRIIDKDNVTAFAAELKKLKGK